MTSTLKISLTSDQKQQKTFTPVTSAKQYMKYLQSLEEEAPTYTIPETVLVTFGASAMERFLARHEAKTTKIIRRLHIIDDGKLGIIGDFGIGAPAMIHRLEELIALGVKRFILVGLAGSLSYELKIGDYAICTEALSEDGVGHLYMPEGETVSLATPSLVQDWSQYIEKKHPQHPKFHHVKTWSFPVIFRESQEDIARVKAEGCRTVEMEVAALYAIAKEKNIDALAIFLISDSLADNVWDPKLKNLSTKEQLTQLTELAMYFVRERM
ncbi:MAG: hypothetical protein CMO81_08285 [Waddliaceae bacterium]|nr:hypothetical protein [Waddliaceae bacterium]